MRINTNFPSGLLFLTAAVLVSVARCQQLTPDEKVGALKVINNLRVSTVPKSADMNGVVWDSALEASAQKAADTCVFEHNYSGEYATLGEVLYRGGNPNLTHVLTFMFLERENYDYKTGQCSTTAKYAFFTTCGHYLQIVFAGVNKVGCGRQLCSGAYLVACEFDRQYTSPPYQTGQPGTKCGNSFATCYKNGLCYAVPVNGQPPIEGPFECRILCMNYGTLVASLCTCICPSGFYGVRCEKKNTAIVSSIPNDCMAQTVTCKNGGSPTMFDALCKCVCPPNFRGDNCEESIEQTDNSIFIYFGGQVIYQSYYPTDVMVWSTTLRNKVEPILTRELNNYCSVNPTICCPKSNQAIGTLVTAGDFCDTDNYPTQGSDGTLIAAVHYRLSATVAPLCRGSDTGYVTKAVLTEAWKQAEPAIKPSAAEAGLTVVRMN